MRPGERDRVLRGNARRRAATRTGVDAAETILRRERSDLARRLLNRVEVESTLDGQVLEIGCGTGTWLRQLRHWGVEQHRLYGLDFDPASLVMARQDTGARLIVGDATELPFAYGAFDLVVISTVLSSLLLDDDRQQLCSGVAGILRPGGAVLLYDFRYPSPANPDVRRQSRSSLRSLFPDFSIDSRTLTLLPPLARRIAGRMPTLTVVLGRIAPLRSHFIAVLRKPE